jgi:periplasmic protein TonB
MTARAAILDQRESLRNPFYGSIALHASLVVALTGWSLWEAHKPRLTWGDIHGGGVGSVAVNVVSRIPLPSDNGPANPVANDTASRVPEPQAQTKTLPKTAAKAPLKDLDAIPLTTRDPLRQRKSASAPNKFRESQKDLPNQLYSQSGQRMVAPDLIAMPGGGDISFGNGSPFGTQFGEYAGIVKNKVAQHWSTAGINPQIRSANPAVATFTIRRDGTVPESSVKVRQKSGIPEMDMSAQRAILEASPFPPLPAQFSGSSVDVEFWFTLRR